MLPEILLPSLPVHDLLFIALGALVGGLTRGFTGFGFAMIFMPIASSVVPPQMALAIVWFIDAPFGLLIGARNYPQADKKSVFTLLGMATLMFPVGLTVLILVEPQSVRWMISGLVIFATLMLASGWRYRGQPGLPLTLGVGAASGLFNGLASLSGLPLALFWLASQTKTPAAIRADMQTYFLFSTLVSGTILGLKGILTLEALRVALLMMPIYGAMLYLGARGYRIASEATFRRIAYLVIALSAILSLPVLDRWLR